jgi:glycosyltransferase involved in cell wall biosynthesis
MFPLWGNGSGAWLRRMISQLNEQYPDFKAAIVAPESRAFKDAKVFPLKPPQMGVFVGNPELPNIKRYSKFTNKEFIDLYNYYLVRTASAIEKFKPDVIHVFHTAFLPAVARQLEVLYRIPFGITTHGSDLYYFKEDSRYVAFTRQASERARFITANSNFTRKWYLRMFGDDLSKKTRVIPGGVGNHIDFSKDVSWIDKKYKFQYPNMVLFTGRLTEHKGVEYLIKAAREIKAEIVILGDGPERGYLEGLITKYKLTNVHMLGYFSQRLGAEINDFYLRADVYVAPSVWAEPLGMVILEAMVYKTPVIVTRSGGVTTIVKDGFNGFLVKAKSASMIADRVNLLFKNDAMRFKMSENAHRSVLDRFNWEKIAAKFHILYEKSAKKKQ